MKKYIYVLIILLSLNAISCSDWLDVKSKSLSDEEELFSHEDGFKEALTGVYMKSAALNLYGRKLTFDLIDILAQRYNYQDNTGKSIYQDPAYYEFPSKLTEDDNNLIWGNMYNVIANVNNLLSWLEKNQNVLTTPDYYEIIKGEAIGMRSMLLFDLLRMYGPVYSENPEGLSIPYRTEFNRDAKELLPADQMLGYIIRDLKIAEDLLEGTDPLDFDYNKIGAGAGEDAFLVFRHNRMNLYAVKALLARVYMYAGNKEMAAQYAQEVIDTRQFTLANSNSAYRMLPSEIIFSLYYTIDYEKEVNDKMDYNSFYTIKTGSGFFESLFNTAVDGMNDFRIKDGSGFAEDYGIKYFLKLKQKSYSPNGMNGVMPILRLPEMYYILAECADDKLEAEGYLNEVRLSRGLAEVTFGTSTSTPEEIEAAKLEQLELEYRKEFYGEGQLWYFYKRHYYRSFLHCPIPVLNERNYVFHIPDNEIMFSNN